MEEPGIAIGNSFLGEMEEKSTVVSCLCGYYSAFL